MNMSYFSALGVPPQVVTALRQITPPIQGATTTHPDDFHLTLKYLGNPLPEVLASFLSTIRTTPVAPLAITVTGLHFFTQPETHFLVAKIAITPELYTLHLAHEAAATALGIAPYIFSSFMPHITMASYPAGMSYNAEPLIKQHANLRLSFTASVATLYQSSKSHGTGVGRYTPVSQI